VMLRMFMRFWICVLMLESLAACRRGQDGKGGLGRTAAPDRIYEVCEVPLPYAGEIRIRGAGRLTDEGLLLGDRTCPAVVDGEEMPRTISVKITRFPSESAEKDFSLWRDSVDRPVFQAVVRGVLVCGQPGVASAAGHGFGRSGRVSCRMGNATAETIARFF